MPQLFGHTVEFTLSPARTWVSLGPGWAVIAGIMSTGYPDFTITVALQIVGLWLLVDPILGTLWDLVVQQGLWRRVVQAQLPPPPTRGFTMPYAQPGSLAGHIVLLYRRYRLWWIESYWPTFGGGVVTFGVGLGLALLLGLAFSPSVFWLVVLTITLIVPAGLVSPDLSTVGAGRLQSVVQFLLPWLMGILLWASLSPLNLVMAVCYGVTYLGGLRMLGEHDRAEILFFFGQIAAILLLLAFRLLSGAAMLSILLAAQMLIKTKFSHAPTLLQKIQPYLILSVLTAGLSLGSLEI